MKSEFSVVGLVGSTLPALKVMLDNQPAAVDPAESSYTGLIHGLLSSGLQNADECRGRSGPAAILSSAEQLRYMRKCGQAACRRHDPRRARTLRWGWTIRTHSNKAPFVHG
jgi:hypothetical protein